MPAAEITVLHEIREVHETARLGWSRVRRAIDGSCRDPRAACLRLEFDCDEYGIARTLERIEGDPAALGALRVDPDRARELWRAAAPEARAAYEATERLAGLVRELQPRREDRRIFPLRDLALAVAPVRPSSGPPTAPTDGLGIPERRAYDELLQAAVEHRAQEQVSASDRALEELRERMDRLDAAERRCDHGRQLLEALLGDQYRDPAAAWERLAGLVEAHGHGGAADLLEADPFLLGERRRVRAPGWRGRIGLADRRAMSRLAAETPAQVRTLGADEEALDRCALLAGLEAGAAPAEARAELQREEAEHHAAAADARGVVQALRARGPAVERARLCLESLSPASRAQVVGALQKVRAPEAGAALRIAGRLMVKIQRRPPMARATPA